MAGPVLEGVFEVRHGGIEILAPAALPKPASVSSRFPTPLQWCSRRRAKSDERVRRYHASPVKRVAVVLPPEAFSGAIWINAAGVAAAIVILGIDWARGKKGAAEVPATPY